MYLCVENGTEEYFDSFSGPLSDVLRYYMNITGEQWTFNVRQLQSTASSFLRTLFHILLFT